VYLKDTFLSSIFPCESNFAYSASH
jgi:hypothetical protein